MEPLTPESMLQLDLIREVQEQRIEGIIATITRIQGELKVQTGSRLLLSPKGVVRETVKHPFVAAAMAEESERSRRTGSHSATLPFTEGSAEVFFEVIQPPISLLIAGAGTDAVPLHRMAKELGWQVTILDHRPALATKERFPMADSLIVAQPEHLNGSLRADNRSAAVIMTHQINHDVLLVPALLDYEFRYVGLLGPRHRKDTLLNHLEQQGVRLTPAQLSRLFGPVGLNIGAESPDEIAVAILAEIQAVMQNRRAGFLSRTPDP